MCSIVDSYVFQDSNVNFFSLKELCAQTCLDIIETNQNFNDFSNIPPTLHVYLAEISILNIFGDDYNANSDHIELPYSFSQLLHFWPWENLILRQLVSYLPPRYRDLRIRMQDGIMRSDYTPDGGISFYLHKFYGLLADAIYEYILTSDARYNIIGVAKIVDLTKRSYYVLYCNKFSPKRVFKILKRRSTANYMRSIWQSVQRRIMATESTKSNERKLEVYVGLSFSQNEYISAMKQILELNKTEPGADMCIYYKKIEMTHAPDDWLDFAQVLIDNGTNCLQFPYGYPGGTDLITICDNLSLLKSIRVESIPLPSIKCLINLQQLTDLSLEDINLNGQLGFLCDLKTSLITLRLEDCNLNNDDLDLLSKSHHTDSLQQVNLSDNSFTDPSEDSVGSSKVGLIGLVSNLTEVRMLNLHWLDLHLWCDSSLQILVKSLKNQQKLTMLKLIGRNLFSERVMITIISKLAESDSLKLITLVFPGDVPYNKLNEFHLTFLKTLHDIRGNNDLQAISGFNHITVIANLDYETMATYNRTYIDDED